MLGLIIFCRSICIFSLDYWRIGLRLIIIFVYIFIFIRSNLFILRELRYIFGVDYISYGFLLLTFWILILIGLASVNLANNIFLNKILFLFNLVLLMIVLIFIRMNFFFFFFFFESRLIPLVVMVIGWGNYPERIQARIYLIFYTFLASFPLLIGIFFIFENLKLMDFYLIVNLNFFFLYFLIIFSFLVKMPIYLFHLWLPKAHVEAPIFGSMLLAGLILKLGGYGMIRRFKVIQIRCIKFSFIFIIISLVGSFYVALICLNQFDMKLIVAYSSVVHIALVLLGVINLRYMGILGSFILIVGHGLCSSGLFVLVNLVYERIGRRSLVFVKGLLSKFSSLVLFWFLLISSNIAAPISLNFISEIQLFISIVSWSKNFILFLILASFFGAVYNLYLFIVSQYLGVLSFFFFNLKVINLREYLLLILHWLPLNILLLNLTWFVG